MTLTTILITAVGGYLLGSIPFGLLFTRMVGMGDIRDIGSGSIGATNVLRTGNKKIAIATLLLDMAKGASSVWIFGALFQSPTASLLAGLAAFIGHCYPIWLKFDGGKGVATYFGIILAISGTATLIAAAIWLTTAYLSRYSSLSALLTVSIVPLVFLVFGDFTQFLVMLLIGIIVFWRHKENIDRLRNGTESKINGTSSD